MRWGSSIFLGAVLLLVGVGSPPASGAVAPLGPRLATIEMIETGSGRLDESTPLMSLATIDLATGSHQRFLHSVFLEPGDGIAVVPFVAPAWTADGSLIAFTAVSRKRPQEAIYVVAPDGSGLRRIPGTAEGTNPVFSPDGRVLAFARTKIRLSREDPARDYASTTTWVVDLSGGEPRRLTRWRNGLENIPGSFAPDGSGLLLTKKDSNLDGPRIVRLPFDGSKPREIVRLGEEPTFSPDGSRIAFVGYLHPDIVDTEEDSDYPAPELYAANADGSGVKRLTRSEDVLESSPSWDPSGQRIAYVQVKGDTSFIPGLALLFPTGNALMQVNADGSCRQRIVSLRKVGFYGVALQPGPGREAGPIAC